MSELPKLTLADLRKLVEETKEWDAQTPVHISVPTFSYISDRGPDKGQEIVDNFISMQATNVLAIDDMMDEDDEPWIEVIMMDPQYLREVYDQYEPED